MSSYYGQESGGEDWSTAFGGATPTQPGPPTGGGGDRKGELAGVRLASVGQRIASGAIDWLPALVVLQVFRSVVTGTSYKTVCSQFLGCRVTTVDSHSLAILGWLLAIAWVAGNQCYLQSRTGQSLGKRVLKTQLAWPVEVSGRTGMVLSLPGPGRCFARAFVDSIFAILGFLPNVIAVALTHRNQSLGDKLVSTVVFAPGHGLDYEAVDPSSARSGL